MHLEFSRMVLVVYSVKGLPSGPESNKQPTKQSVLTIPSSRTGIKTIDDFPIPPPPDKVWPELFLVAASVVVGLYDDTVRQRLAVDGDVLDRTDERKQRACHHVGIGRL